MIVEDVGVGLSSPAAICRVHFEQLECYDDLQLGIDVPWRNDRLFLGPGIPECLTSPYDILAVGESEA